jgi:ABC-type glycerol-3-phosphate transport system permease component
MTVERKTSSVTLWLILFAIGITNVIPFFWVLSGSFKPHYAIHAGKIWPWQSYEVRNVDAQGKPLAGPEAAAGQAPREYNTFDNYSNVTAQLTGLPTYYFNTFDLAAAGTFLSLFLGSLAGYGFARFKFRGNRLLFMLLLLTIMLPAEVTLIGRYELMFQFRLFDRIMGLLIAYVAGSLLLIIFIMRNVFASIPEDLVDAAMIDGAGTWQVFWDLMVPVGRNGLAACAILTFIGIWNEFLFALTFTSLDKVRTLPVGIYMLQEQFGLFNSGMLFATVLLSFLPITIVFILLQKYFVSGLSAGALKQ